MWPPISPRSPGSWLDDLVAAGFRPRPTCFLWEGSPGILHATTFVGEYVRGVVMTEDWESVRYV